MLFSRPLATRTNGSLRRTHHNVSFTKEIATLMKQQQQKQAALAPSTLFARHRLRSQMNNVSSSSSRQSMSAVMNYTKDSSIVEVFKQMLTTSSIYERNARRARHLRP